jgi:Transglycosylase SLT domain
MVAIFASSMLLSAARAERALSATPRAGGLSIDPFAAFVTEASKRFGVPEHWIRAVMHAESAGKLRARLQKGAIGLMQFMPKTWAELRARYRLGANPYDPRDNILAGAAYIRELDDHYGSPGFLAAYNAGPSRYERDLATGRPLPDETQAYVATLARMVEGNGAHGKTAAVTKSFSWLAHRCSLRAPRTAQRTAGRRTTCIQKSHQAFGPLSIYRPLCRGRAPCSCIVRARSDRNEPDRISSRSVGQHRTF